MDRYWMDDIRATPGRQKSAKGVQRTGRGRLDDNTDDEDLDDTDADNDNDGDIDHLPGKQGRSYSRRVAARARTLAQRDGVRMSDLLYQAQSGDRQAEMQAAAKIQALYRHAAFSLSEQDAREQAEARAWYARQVPQYTELHHRAAILLAEDDGDNYRELVREASCGNREREIEAAAKLAELRDRATQFLSE